MIDLLLGGGVEDCFMDFDLDCFAFWSLLGMRQSNPSIGCQHDDLATSLNFQEGHRNAYISKQDGIDPTTDFDTVLHTETIIELSYH
jgi:hypothetical protein